MGMAVSVVGNHEFDRGTDELRRIPGATDGTFTDGVDACDDVGLPSDYCFPDSQNQPFAGTDFPYLAANVVVKGTTTRCCPRTRSSTWVAGSVWVSSVWSPRPPAPSSPPPASPTSTSSTRPTPFNRWAAVLQGQGVQSIVALVHEGGVPETPAQVAGCAS